MNPLLSATALLLTTIALVGCAGYIIGEWRGSKHTYTPALPERREVETALVEEIVATTSVIELPPASPAVDELPPREMLEP